MSNIRTFYLTNEQGVIYDLNDTNHWLYKPDGLGFDMNYSYINQMNNLSITDVTKADSVIGGDMLFSSYKEQQVFSEYIKKSQNLKLYYAPASDEDITKTPKVVEANVVVQNFTKTEKQEETGLLSCPIQFLRLSNWKGDKVITNIIKSNSTEHKQYDYEYVDRNGDHVDNIGDGYKYGTEQIGVVMVNNEGFNTVPLDISINGETSNPKISIRNVFTNEVDQSMQVFGSLSSSDFIIIKSGINELEVLKNRNTNMYGSVNKNLNSFLYLPPGRWRIEYASDTPVWGEVSISFAPEYDHV